MSEGLYPRYYDSRKYFRGYFDRHARRGGLRPGLNVRSWQRRARRRLIELLGLRRMQAAAPRARLTDSADCGHYLRERWLMQTQRQVTMPFFVIRPKHLFGPLRAVICPHGHGGGGKVAPAGVELAEPVARSIREHNYDYGLYFARAGLLAFCPDARGFGERQEREVRRDVLASSCHQLQLMGAPLGIPVAGMWVFDLMRLVDHVLARKDVLGQTVGCAGLSGGGLQTLLLSAADTRVACAVVSGYFYGVRQSLLEMPGNCDCNLIPHLWEDFDMGDLAALIAPRALLIETGDADPLNGASGLGNVAPQLAIARRAYRALKVEGRLYHDVFRGGHRWSGLHAISWMRRHLAG